MLKSFVCSLFIGLMLVLATVAANAQAASDGTKSVLDALKPALEQAEKSGATVIVVAPREETEAGSVLVSEASLTDRLMRAKFRFGLIWRGHAKAWGHMRQTLAKASPDGRRNWLLHAIVAGIVSLVAGRLLTKSVDQFAIRTKVFTLIRELFEKEGIKFAHREVTVRVNDDSNDRQPADVKAAAAAAGVAAAQTGKPATS